MKLNNLDHQDKIIYNIILMISYHEVYATAEEIVQHYSLFSKFDVRKSIKKLKDANLIEVDTKTSKTKLTPCAVNLDEIESPFYLRHHYLH